MFFWRIRQFLSENGIFGQLALPVSQSGAKLRRGRTKSRFEVTDKVTYITDPTGGRYLFNAEEGSA